MSQSSGPNFDKPIFLVRQTNSSKGESNLITTKLLPKTGIIIPKPNAITNSSSGKV